MDCPHCNGTGEVSDPGLGTLMTARRKALGLTQAEVSAKCGLGRAQIANIEGGRTDVPTKTLIRIAEALSCRPGDLLP
jgi:transcriptional regulator with XRE-family HTH domain